MYYHVHLEEKMTTSEGSYVLDITEEEVMRRFVRPLNRGQSLFIRGREFSKENIESICISKTEEESKIILTRIREDRKKESVAAAISDEYYLVNEGYGEDVTDELYEADRRGMQDSEDEVANNNIGSNPRSVFVVHGRNDVLRKAMFEFLVALDLKPIQWREAVSATGIGSPLIGDILGQGLNMAQAIIVMLTPDEVVKIRDELVEDGKTNEVAFQPRPNVLYEAGMAMQMGEKRTILVRIGEQRTLSDLKGRHYVELDNTFDKRRDLVQRLKTAGCAVDDTGDGWHKAGSFEIPEDWSQTPDFNDCEKTSEHSVTEEDVDKVLCSSLAGMTEFGIRIRYSCYDPVTNLRQGRYSKDGSFSIARERVFWLFSCRMNVSAIVDDLEKALLDDAKMAVRSQVPQRKCSVDSVNIGQNDVHSIVVRFSVDDLMEPSVSPDTGRETLSLTPLGRAVQRRLRKSHAV